MKSCCSIAQTKYNGYCWPCSVTYWFSHSFRFYRHPARGERGRVRANGGSPARRGASSEGERTKPLIETRRAGALLAVGALALLLSGCSTTLWYPWGKPQLPTIPPPVSVPPAEPSPAPVPVPTPVPTPVPSPTPTPPEVEPTPPVQPPVGFGYPRKVEQVRAKVHVPASERPDGNAIVDAVALACGANPDFAGRICWPACGPEGTSGRQACDVGLPVFWIGGLEHPTNPWLRRVPRGESVKACVGGEGTKSGDDVCSSAVVGR